MLTRYRPERLRDSRNSARVRPANWAACPDESFPSSNIFNATISRTWSSNPPVVVETVSSNPSGTATSTCPAGTACCPSWRLILHGPTLRFCFSFVRRNRRPNPCASVHGASRRNSPRCGAVRRRASVRGTVKAGIVPSGPSPTPSARSAVSNDGRKTARRTPTILDPHLSSLTPLSPFPPFPQPVIQNPQRKTTITGRRRGL